MAKRTSVRKFNTEEVQGEGSYVILSSLKIDEIRELRKASKDDKYDIFEGGLEMLEKHILKYNWVGDDGKPLPLPKNDPSVIGQLTHEETEFLSSLLIEAGSKNSESGSPKPSG